MSGWESRTIELKGMDKIDVDDLAVGYVLAYLAEFPEGSIVRRSTNIYHQELNKHCVVGFHRDTLDKVGHDHPMTLGPDFIVTRVHRPPDIKKGETTWQKTDNYFVDAGPKVDIDLIEKIQVGIDLAYSQGRSDTPRMQ